MQIKIVLTGKPKNCLKDFIEEYVKRANRFLKTELVYIKDNNTSEDKILKLVNANKSLLIALDERGEEFATLEFADFLEKNIKQGNSLFFVVGPANGFTDEFKRKADFLLSLSKLTMPHEIAGLALTESVYRALSVLNNHPYHRA